MAEPVPVKPLVGITCCNKAFGEYATRNHAASDTYVRATDWVVGAVPVLVPANGAEADVPTLIDRLDGLILTGSRSNVSPALYGGPAHPEGTPVDPRRDAVTMALIRRAIAVGMPLLAICRGFQELNVALGGTLHQRLQDLPGRLDHSAPRHPDAAVRVAKRHEVRLAPGGLMRRLLGRDTVMVNSLHNEGIDRLAPGLAIEGAAPDGTVEAVRVADATGWTLGCQWHPEADAETDESSRAIFRAFGDAVRARRAASA